MKNLSKYLGCLIGGAAGDALGYAVEFSDIDEIRRIYREKGIQRYAKTSGKALISDDTQMTLFTANGLLLGKTRARMRGISGSVEGYIHCAYLDWLYTQTGESPWNNQYTWLRNVKRLNARRAPGNTCLSALFSGKCGTIEEPINNSKGYGGVMRVAPRGLQPSAGRYGGGMERPLRRAYLGLTTHSRAGRPFPAIPSQHSLHAARAGNGKPANVTINAAQRTGKENYMSKDALMLTTTQAALKWGVARRTVLAWIYRGKLPQAIRYGRDWLIPADTPRPKDRRFK